ncbi:MAG: hypothetical protein AAGJ87_16270 [Pseudomonadota bacterium]
MNNRTSLFAIIAAQAALLSSTISPAEAGLFRTREYFNVRADGHWLKGRCFMPGAVTIPPEDNYVILSRLGEFGCIVKSRKGKRRARKRKADMTIGITFFGQVDRGRLIPIDAGEVSCTHSRRCDFIPRNPVGLPSGIPRGVGGDVKIVGMTASICGRRNDERQATRFFISVGDVDVVTPGRNVTQRRRNCPIP